MDRADRLLRSLSERYSSSSPDARRFFFTTTDGIAPPCRPVGQPSFGLAYVSFARSLRHSFRVATDYFRMLCDPTG